MNKLEEFDSERVELETILDRARSRIVSNDIDKALMDIGDAQAALDRIEEALEG